MFLSLGMNKEASAACWFGVFQDEADADSFTVENERRSVISPEFEVIGRLFRITPEGVEEITDLDRLT